jgi:hypothetical protein
MPYLLEIKMTNPIPPHNQRWVLVQSVADRAEGLRVASNMSQCYAYRLYIGPDYGYEYLEWEDDPTDPDLCVPNWVYKGV